MGNKTGKPAFAAGRYFKYAIGEIVLVVIGILIALQINNWNEVRKEKILEVKLLKDLVIEMKYNKARLEHAQLIHSKHDSISSIILKNNTAVSPIDYLQRLLFSTYFTTTDFTNGNIESILSEYGPSIISNDTLKEFITSWKDMAHDITENELIEQTLIFDQVFPTISKQLDLSKLARYRLDLDKYLLDIQFQSDIKILMSNREFMGVVYSKRFNDRLLINGDLEATLEVITNAIRIAEKQLEY